MELNFKLIEDAIPLLLAGAGITLEITAMSVGAAFGTNLSGIFCAAYHYRPAH